MPQVGPRPPGPVRNLRLTRTATGVALDWDIPEFGPNRDKLLQFQVFRMQFTGHSTAPDEILVGATPPSTLSWLGPDVQTAIHSRQDVVAYVVKPIYESLVGQTQGLVYAGPGATVAASP